MITREIATKVRDVVDAGLVFGVGVPEPGKLCVEAAVCLALGLPHGDDPGCVSPSLRALKIRLNDSRWSSPQARAAGLRRLAVAQLGSKGVLDNGEFVRRVAKMTIRSVVPSALRIAAKRVPKKHEGPLLAAAERCEKEGTKQAAREGQKAAYAAAADAASAADAANAYAAADAAYAGYAYAAAAADACAGYASADARTRDRVLAEFAESVVQILIAMNAPGCQWLDLVEVAS